jgi:hypothetical protein
MVESYTNDDYSEVSSMKALLISIVASLVLLCLAQPAHSKLHVKVAVKVDNDADGKMQKTLQEGMTARLNSTERYTLSDDPMVVNLQLSATCIVLENHLDQKTGIGCHSEVIYYPFDGSPLSTIVEAAGHLAVGGINDSSFLVDALMGHFINGTTDAELADRKKIMQQGIRLLCAQIRLKRD